MDKIESRSGSPDWIRLDNAATLFPSVASERITTLFRLAATLTAPVKLGPLQSALENIAPRFPYFLVHLKAGFFWYYLVRRDGPPRVIADSHYPSMGISPKLRGEFLFRVRAFGCRIAVEFSHVLTDGTGALAFLRALLVEYFELTGVKTADSGDVFRATGSPDPEEYEDAYRRYFNRTIPGPESHKHAFQLPYRLAPPGVYKIVTGVVPVERLTSKAKEQGVTVTVFLASILIFVLQELYFELPPRARRSSGKFIRIEIPVNLRRIFPSKTLRNFSLFVMPGIDLRLGSYGFDEVLKDVHHYMQVAISSKKINQQIARNIRGERNPFVRIIPLVVKNLVLPYLYYSLGEALISSVITNLGPVAMPESVAAMIERFEFIPAPSKLNKTNCAIASWGPYAYITFGRVVQKSEVERRFFSTLVKMGIPVRIESN